MALAQSGRFIFADEFTSSLDRIGALSVAYRLRKETTRSGKIFVLASSHEDILADLRPDVIIIQSLTGQMQTLYKDPARDPSVQVRFRRKR